MILLDTGTTHVLHMYYIGSTSADDLIRHPFRREERKTMRLFGGKLTSQKELIMASKKSIYLSDAAEKIIGAGGGSLSGRINTLLTRYDEMISKSCPPLEAKEWGFLCSLLNGTVLDTDTKIGDVVSFLWAEIADVDPEMEEDFEVNANILSQQIRKMSYTQQCAIIGIISRYWASDTADTGASIPDFEPILVSVGANIKKPGDYILRPTDPVVFAVYEKNGSWVIKGLVLAGHSGMGYEICEDILSRNSDTRQTRECLIHDGNVTREGKKYAPFKGSNTDGTYDWCQKSGDDMVALTEITEERLVKMTGLMPIPMFARFFDDYSVSHKGTDVDLSDPKSIRRAITEFEKMLAKRDAATDKAIKAKSRKQ